MGVRLDRGIGGSSFCFFRASRRALDGSPRAGDGAGGGGGGLRLPFPLTLPLLEEDEECPIGLPGGPAGAVGKSMAAFILVLDSQVAQLLSFANRFAV